MNWHETYYLTDHAKTLSEECTFQTWRPSHWLCCIPRSSSPQYCDFATLVTKLVLQGNADNNIHGTFSTELLELAVKTVMCKHTVSPFKEKLGLKTNILTESLPHSSYYKRMSLALPFALACTSLHVRPNSHSSVVCGHARVLHGWADIRGGNIRTTGEWRLWETV